MNQEPDNYETKHQSNSQVLKIFWLIVGSIVWIIAVSKFLIVHFSG